jgi:nitrous oxidase accessory protein
MRNSCLIIFMVCLVLHLPIVLGAARTIRVSPDEQYADLRNAIENALSGDTIQVNGGTYDGRLKIDKPLTLIGKSWPIIDGKNQGTVIEFAASRIHIEGFVIANSGNSLSKEDAGITVNAPNAIIRNNRISDVLFGVYLKQAHHSIISNNEISGKEELAIPRRGDLIRVWYSDSVLIENNNTQHGRDVIIWFSKGTILKKNRMTNARYGVHFMYSDDCTIEDNISMGNSVGVYLMYSRRLVLRHNTVAYNRGATGFGIGLKDFDDGIVTENLIVDNQIGLFVDNSPREVESSMNYEGNVIAYNDVGISLLSFILRSHIINNSFIENYEQVAINTSGNTNENENSDGNQWTNNYWSDYAGYDQNGDGNGDIPYKSEKLFENLMAQNPRLRLFIYSPAIQAIDFAAKMFPLVKPTPKLTDLNPLMREHIPVGLASVNLPTQWGLIISSLSLLIFGSIALRFSRKSRETKQYVKVNNVKAGNDLAPIIRVKGLVKRFGQLTAVNDTSFLVKTGEAVAFWGSNGAGKTTVLRCLLGIMPHEGSIEIGGFNVSKAGKSARELIGFVPQEISFHDNLSVGETLEFYARLKKTSTESVQGWIDKLGLKPNLAKTIKELSGGMKQKLALGIALLGNPPILFLDEPTANLDMHSRDDFLDLLNSLKNDGKTIVFSSHRSEEVFSFADRVLVLDQGNLIADCPPSEVYEKLGKQSFLKLYVSQRQRESAIKILSEKGYQVSPNGNGVKVKVDSHMKGHPIQILAGEGITVNDFEYEVEK